MIHKLLFTFIALAFTSQSAFAEDCKLTEEREGHIYELNYKTSDLSIKCDEEVPKEVICNHYFIALDMNRLVPYSNYSRDANIKAFNNKSTIVKINTKFLAEDLMRFVGGNVSKYIICEDAKKIQRKIDLKLHEMRSYEEK